MYHFRTNHSISLKIDCCVSKTVHIKSLCVCAVLKFCFGWAAYSVCHVSRNPLCIHPGSMLSKQSISSSWYHPINPRNFPSNMSRLNIIHTNSMYRTLTLSNEVSLIYWKRIYFLAVPSIACPLSATHTQPWTENWCKWIELCVSLSQDKRSVISQKATEEQLHWWALRISLCF